MTRLAVALVTLLAASTATAAPLTSSVVPIDITLSPSSTSGLKECAPATFEWTHQQGGQGGITYPLYLRIHTAPAATGGEVVAMQAEEDEAVITQAERATWMVDYPAGTVV